MSQSSAKCHGCGNMVSYHTDHTCLDGKGRTINRKGPVAPRYTIKPAKEIQVYERRR